MTIIISKTLLCIMFFFNGIVMEKPHSMIQTFHSEKTYNEKQLQEQKDREHAQQTISFAFDSLKYVDDKFKKILLSGIYSTYRDAPNIKNALAAFDSLVILRPERPEGYFCKASLYASIYRIQPAQLYYDSLKLYTDKTVEISKALLKTYPNDKFLYLYLGCVHGGIGLHYLEKKKYWSAYKNGSRGKNYLKKAVEIDPEFADAQLGLGMYLYYADLLSPLLKTILYFVGLSGDRDAGLEKIKYAIQHGQFSQIEATIFLLKIYDEYEGKSKVSVQLVNNLIEHFPDNYYFKFMRAKLFYRNGLLTESLADFNELLNNPSIQIGSYSQNVNFYLGRLYYLIGEYNRSIDYLASVFINEKTSREYKEYFVEKNYLLGMNYELLGDHTYALHFFKNANRYSSQKYSEHIRNMLKNPLNKNDVSVIEVDNLLNKKLFADNEREVIKNLDELNRFDVDDYVYYNTVFLLQKAEAQFRQHRISDALLTFNSLNSNSLSNNDVYRARYYILGAEIHHALNITERSKKYIAKLGKLDGKALPVMLLRKINTLQYIIIGSVKFRLD